MSDTLEFKVSITDLGNAAFGESKNDACWELVRILTNVAERLRHGDYCGTLHDINGNRVGSFGFAESSTTSK